MLPPHHMKPQITTNCHKRNLLSRRKKYSKATFSLFPVRNLLISVFPLLATMKGPKQETLCKAEKSLLDSRHSKFLKGMSLLRPSWHLSNHCGEWVSPGVPMRPIDPMLTSASLTAWNEAERSGLLCRSMVSFH